MHSRIQYILSFTIWALLNANIGIWEVYAFWNRSKLTLESVTLWEKIKQGKISFSNFWLEAWSEYCKVDARYITAHYVWVFELLNCFLAFGFILALLINSILAVKIILTVQIINCLCYFLTLGYSFARTKEQRPEYSIGNHNYWMYPVYYLISAIWIIVPSYLLYIL
jgi:hypothetical protein